ncbi:permease [Clostridium formicaceticum]|nr:permease [Clostridium formicaceticum]AOY78210.1 permease [Clostridium formicaceticum]
MNSYVMYIVVIVLLIISSFKDKKKTKLALKKAWKSFENILPQFLGVIMLVGILLAAFNAEVISKIIGSESGWLGVIFSAVVGAITLIPGFVAFPTAAMLLNSGAGYMQIGAFVSALMMVGVVTAPVEMKYFGRRLTIMRNVLAFLFSFVVAYIIGKVAGGIWFY